MRLRDLQIGTRYLTKHHNLVEVMDLTQHRAMARYGASDCHTRRATADCNCARKHGRCVEVGKGILIEVKLWDRWSTATRIGLLACTDIRETYDDALERVYREEAAYDAKIKEQRETLARLVNRWGTIRRELNYYFGGEHQPKMELLVDIDEYSLAEYPALKKRVDDWRIVGNIDRRDSVRISIDDLELLIDCLGQEPA